MESIIHNPLDNILTLPKYSGMAITANNLYGFIPECADAKEIEKYLKNWVKRHEESCQVLKKRPYTVKIFTMSKELDNYNRNMHRKNMEKWKRRSVGKNE